MNDDKMISAAIESRGSLGEDEYHFRVRARNGAQFLLYGPVVDGLHEGMYHKDLEVSVADLLVEVERMLHTGFARAEPVREIASRQHGTEAVVSILEDVWAWERVEA